MWEVHAPCRMSRVWTCFGERRELVHAPGIVCIALPGVLQGLLDLGLLPAAMHRLICVCAGSIDMKCPSKVATYHKLYQMLHPGSVLLKAGCEYRAVNAVEGEASGDSHHSQIILL